MNTTPDSLGPVVRAAVIQINSGADVAANLDAAKALLQQAHDGGARLAVLPENFAFMGEREHDKLAHAEVPGSGPLQGFLAEMAAAMGLWIVGGTLPMKAPDDPDRVLAASLVFDPQGRQLGRYDKIHLFDVDVGGGERAYRESASIAPGAPTPVCLDTPVGKGGLTVCYDLRFPELYRALAADGAQWLSVPSAFTARTGEVHWQPLLQARAIENQCFVLASNQCGQHPSPASTERRSWGHSLIIGPWGDILSECDHRPGIAIADLDFAAQRELRNRFPVLRHRRL
jgi:predicted amidohydrolase